MTDDRELLEMAAKAARMFVLPEPWPKVSGWFYCMQHGRHALHFRDPERPGRSYVPAWIPLDDDGDALRLAVRLKLEILPIEGGGVDIQRTTEDEPFGVLLASECGQDDCAATRRAIVRAAAEIGRAMP